MHKREISLGGSTLSIETGRLAKQASGSVFMRFGDTVVLVTACYAQSERAGIDFLPLTVDYREYAYASGRIPGGFFKREGKATEKEVLTSRCIDRPLRPLFPAGWHHETQVIALTLSADENYDPDVVAIGEMRDYETIVNLIARTTTAAGLKVTCRLDRRKYATGHRITNEEMTRIRLVPARFHGEWNYTLSPRR